MRHIRMEVAFSNGDATPTIVSSDDYIKTAKITRQGEDSKFFGFGIAQKINLHLVDTKRKINVVAGTAMKIKFIENDTTEYVFPNFYITEVRRDERTNELSITAYDMLYRMKNKTIQELGIIPPYTIKEMINKIADYYNMPYFISNPVETQFNLNYPSGANLQGDELVRDVLNMIAEATQSIYYLNILPNQVSDTLIFSTLGGEGYSIEVSREDYFEFKVSDNRRLQSIQSITELGDNYAAETTQTGTTQYIRNNAFLDMRDDVQAILNEAIKQVGNMTISQFQLDWRGKMLVYPNTTLLITQKDGTQKECVVINDTINYDGSFQEDTQWKYVEAAETAEKPAYIGDVVKQTSAKVDKVKQEITLNVEKTDDNRKAISDLVITTSGIQTSVSAVDEKADRINGDLGKLSKSVSTKTDAESVQIQINKALENGVERVETTTGFTFNEDGLTVSKKNKDITTTISEDGMSVYRSGVEVLTANNEGVHAEDLHATTYLIIGKNSRLEDFGRKTACFWIGGV